MAKAAGVTVLGSSQGIELGRRKRIGITLLSLYMVFTIVNYLYALAYSRPDMHTRVSAPTWIFLLKDILWIGICFLMVVRALYAGARATPGPVYVSRGNNRTAMLLAACFLFFLAVSFSHLTHQEPTLLLLEDWKNLALYASVAFLLPLWIREEGDVRGYVSLLLALGVAESVCGWLNRALLPAYTLGGRVIGTLEHPNHLGFFLAMILLLMTSKLLLSQRRGRALWYVGIASCLAATLLTYSLGAFVTLGAGLAVLAVASRKLERLGWVLLIMGLTAASMAAGGLLQPAYEKTELAIASAAQPSIAAAAGSTTVSGRLAATQDVLAYMKQASVPDLLFGDYSLTVRKDYDSFWWTLARNDGLLVVLLFILLFLAIAGVGFRKYRAFRKQENDEMAWIMLGSATFVLVASAISFHITSYLTKFPLQFYFYFLCGVILVANPNSPREQGTND